LSYGAALFDRIYKYIGRESKEEKEEREKRELEADRRLLISSSSMKPAALGSQNSDLVSKTRRPREDPKDKQM
jgi:hypothetical protein